MENTCMMCGRIIPEGRHICLLCERGDDMQTFRPRREKTNGDRLREMSDEELALLIKQITDRCWNPDTGCRNCPLCYNGVCRPDLWIMEKY